MWGDENRLSQVLANLIASAAKFSGSGGLVEVLIEHHKGLYRVSVNDTGPGIAPEFSGKIFQRFAQVDSGDACNESGTGLGLGLSKSIVGNHQGSIDYTTELAKGSVFYFELPRNAA